MHNSCISPMSANNTYFYNETGLKHKSKQELLPPEKNTESNKRSTTPQPRNTEQVNLDFGIFDDCCICALWHVMRNN